MAKVERRARVVSSFPELSEKFAEGNALTPSDASLLLAAVPGPHPPGRHSFGGGPGPRLRNPLPLHEPDLRGRISAASGLVGRRRRARTRGRREYSLLLSAATTEERAATGCRDGRFDHFPESVCGKLRCSVVTRRLLPKKSRPMEGV